MSPRFVLSALLVGGFLWLVIAAPTVALVVTAYLAALAFMVFLLVSAFDGEWWLP